jgi:hypothetical protein
LNCLNNFRYWIIFCTCHVISQTVCWWLTHHTLIRERAKKHFSKTFSSNDQEGIFKKLKIFLKTKHLIIEVLFQAYLKCRGELVPLAGWEKKKSNPFFNMMIKAFEVPVQWKVKGVTHTKCLLSVFHLHHWVMDFIKVKFL